MIRRKTRLSVLLYIILTIFTSQVSAVISDHVLHIEMSTTYKFGTSSMAPIEYCFDAWMEVDNTVVSGTVETPGGDCIHCRIRN